MIDARTKMLKATVSKLYRRGAEGNIRRILSRTHTADVASLLENLGTEERIAVYSLIEDVEKRAEIVSYLNETIQEEILSILSNSEVQDLVSNMERDDAADLLQRLPEDLAQSILSGMVQEDSVQVGELMAHPEDSAGGLMSSEFTALPESLTVGEAIKAIQREDDDQVAFYIYVVNKKEQLVGVLSLRQLILSRPTTHLKDVMSTDVLSVHLNTDRKEVAHIVEKYDFLSLPVVDEDHKLVGIITVDDVIDVIREEAAEDFLTMGRAGWSGEVSFKHHLLARSPWALLAYFSGTLCFILLYVFMGTGSLNEDLGFWREVWSFVPLLLTLGSTLAHQSTTFTVGALRSGHLNGHLRTHIVTEMGLGAIFAVFLGSLSGLLLSLILNSSVALWLGLSLMIHILFSLLMGSVTPLVVRRWGMDPAVSSLSFLTALVDVSAVAILLLLVKIFVV